MPLIILIILIALLFGGLGWSHTGYYGGPYLGGGVGLVVLILVILLVLR